MFGSVFRGMIGHCTFVSGQNGFIVLVADTAADPMQTIDTQPLRKVFDIRTHTYTLGSCHITFRYTDLDTALLLHLHLLHYHSHIG